MKLVSTSFSTLSRFALAGLLATAGVCATAQTTPASTSYAGSASPAATGYGEHMGHHDPAKMQAWIAKRQAELKTKLSLTPAQEGAWTSFTSAMQPPAHPPRPTHEQRAEFDKLTTPERIDKMRVMRTQHMTEMTAAIDKRGDATKTFYAVLTPVQQKAFDTEHKKHVHHGAGHDDGVGQRKS